MASTAIVARGTTLGVGDAASPEVYTTIANLDGWSGPSSNAADIEITDLSSTSKEFLLDLIDHGTVSVQGNFDPSNTQHIQLESDNRASTARNYQIKFVSSATSPAPSWTFNARVSEFSVDPAIASALRMSFTLRVTGDKTVA